jgi:hypothetical protein
MIRSPGERPESAHLAFYHGVVEGRVAALCRDAERLMTETVTDHPFDQKGMSAPEPETAVSLASHGPNFGEEA